jgi:hypothetical protein
MVSMLVKGLGLRSQTDEATGSCAPRVSRKNGIRCIRWRTSWKTVSLLLPILILGALGALASGIGAPASSQDLQWDGDLGITVYPDDHIQVEIEASMTSQIEAWASDPIFYNIALDAALSPAGEGLTKFEGSMVQKFGPMFTIMLASLELDVVVHGEGLDSQATILASQAGVAALECSIASSTDEATMETTLDVEATVTIWHTVYPQEQFELLVDMFPTLKLQLISQVSEMTGGNITIQELVLENVEINPVSTSATLRVSVVGHFAKGMLALARSMYPYYVDEIPDIETTLYPGEMTLIELRSYDLHLTFDETEQALLLEVEALMEGDVDGQFNAYKDQLLEEMLQEVDFDPEQTWRIVDFFLPTDVGVSNLGVDFEYTNDGETASMDFNLGGLELRPPDPVDLLTILQDASSGGPEEGLTLTLEGGEDEDGYVEIQVPEATTDPLLEEPRRVVWAFSDLEALDQVSFVAEEREQEQETGTPPFGTTTIVLVGGGAAVLAAAAWMLSKRT